MFSILSASEVTLEFRSVTTSVVGTNSPLLGKSVEVTWNVDSFGSGLEQDFSYISDKGLLTTGPRIEVGNVVTHMGLYTPMSECSMYYSYVGGLRCELECYVVEGLVVREPLVYIEYTPFNRAVRVQRGADRRGARRMHRVMVRIFGLRFVFDDLSTIFWNTPEFLVLHSDLNLVRKVGSLQINKNSFMKAFPKTTFIPHSRGGRGRRARRVQPEVQPVAQATDTAAPITHVDLAAME
ncbi:ty3-gypsy retrotransposon protein [Cucumis melo var. makuwa]|uniref:Ty3-gypsy retrotransposon protein n=1 Tax=Cucumis melo var. makuwa TaxID=1194695 RepID=A0A5A7TN48_CUCMM|nr:ty3-gypsy retrotransposon protein [Cucumis melo var. makuwa]